MKANELRIGNWVYDPLYHWVQVNCINCPDTYYDMCFPISLTPEILEKCGFKKFYESGYQTKYEARRATIDVVFRKNEIIVYHRGDRLIEIQHLHQLQNLYFALAGVELTVTL